MPQKGRIFDIQRFSIDDGPGIRTTFFLKGCNLRCPWCHNPESISPRPQLLYYTDRCLNCGRCAQACPHRAHQMTPDHSFQRELCQACGQCTQVCPGDALHLSGRWITPQEVLQEALKDEAFFRTSGGGVTFSGGEPLLQADFLLETLKLCQQARLHTAIDTAGHVPWQVFQKVLPYTDVVLFDVKASDTAAYQRLTGQADELIMDNLKRLSQGPWGLYIRMPLVKGFNYNGPEDPRWLQTLDKLCQLSRIDQLDLLPYHRLGEGKNRLLGHCAQTDKNQMFETDELQTMLAQARERDLPAFCQAISND